MDSSEVMNINTDNQPATRVLIVSDGSILETYSLVLSAVNIPHNISPGSDNTFELHVPTHLRERALYEIATYVQENRNWPPPAVAEFRFWIASNERMMLIPKRTRRGGDSLNDRPRNRIFAR